MTIPVKLPKEILNLFPTWEYRCPACSTYVESNISFCPNCKTAFDEKRWRVPPRFLKSHKTMSEYAHKVLASKLTPEQRKLLFQYFTELFSDGFESGDFSAWTGTSGSPSVVESPVHHGSYAAEFDASGEYANKTFTGQTTVFARLYLRFDTLPGNSDYFHFFHLRGGGSAIARLDILRSAGGQMRIYFLRNYPSGTANYDYDFVVDTWYCFELKFVKDASDGEYRVWLDGNEVITVTGLDTSGADDADEIRVGQISATYTVTSYVDCVVVADTYIGPESMEQTYTKTWTTDVLFKKLAIPTAFSVDTAFQKQNIPKTFGLDATFQKSFSFQKQVDAIFKRFDILKSFAVDARFGALITHTTSRQIDVLLKKLDATKTFGLDVYFGPAEAQAYVKTFALDVIFAYKVRLPELWLDENGKMVLNISKPYTWVGT